MLFIFKYWYSEWYCGFLFVIDCSEYIFLAIGRL